MKNLSPVQACLIWSDLEQAYYGDHSYGSDVAEIYAYRFMRYHPNYHQDHPNKENPFYQQARQEVLKETIESLYEILCLFRDQRECTVEIGIARDTWRPVGEWLLCEVFDHRIHVRVVHKAE